MLHTRSKWLVFDFIIAMLILQSVFTVSAAPLPAGPGEGGGPIDTQTVQMMNAGQSLTKVVNEYGLIKLSIDALGTLSNDGNIQVDKPVGGKVRKAYLMAATTGWSYYQLLPGDITILGNNIAWEKEIPNSISSFNYWAEVTAVVKPTIDSAPAGLVDIAIHEGPTVAIDGEILAVIFDDPNQLQKNTVLLYFGAQNVDGDSFVLDFGQPVDKDDPNLLLDYSLGISYGCVTTGFCAMPLQYSVVDVNGKRLTTSAGGEDDGFHQNGALITAGGIGDSHDNPPDPNATSADPRADDELYDLRPLVNDGDTSVTISTSNPSDDDNILFAALMMGSTRTVVNVDLDISLYNNPTTTQARAPYEAILNYMADGIFESSNGANKLAKVTFHPLGASSSTADVVWIEKCHPNANVSGFSTDGLHINMCDIFKDGSGSGVDYNFLADAPHHQGGGYTMAHEFGHYYFSLYDEYVGATADNSIFHFPHSTDKAVTNSIMNRQWSAVGGNFNWLNFSIPKNDTKETAQYRVYQASGWTTLVRPVTDDPQDGDRAALPGRLFHSELKDVQPAENTDVVIDLPGTARSAVAFTWESAPAPALQEAALAIPLNAQLSSIYGQNISYPDPILLLAFVHSDLTVIDMGVMASVKLPDGTVQPVTFTDDGVSPDAEKADGLYSAILGYTKGGLYTVDIQFDNGANLAKFVSTAFTPTGGEGGDPLPAPAPVLVNEPFTLTQSLQVVVSNVKPDDYGSTLEEAAAVTSDNTPYSGKIDFVGDKDVFQLTTMGAGVTYVRVTGLALGAKPLLRIYAADKTSLLYSGALDLAQSEYLFIPLGGVQPGALVYAEVSDQLADAAGGLYQFSAGPKLASDDTYKKILYIPVIIK